MCTLRDAPCPHDTQRPHVRGAKREGGLATTQLRAPRSNSAAATRVSRPTPSLLPHVASWWQRGEGRCRQPSALLTRPLSHWPEALVRRRRWRRRWRRRRRIPRQCANVLMSSGRAPRPGRGRGDGATRGGAVACAAGPAGGGGIGSGATAAAHRGRVRCGRRRPGCFLLCGSPLGRLLLCGSPLL